ncbi:MAG: hypothetical protein FWH14_03190 [Oscillospiraceae bacterium]|nr:hypothetical protein [Oscillospiraceae bacterium]
MPERKHFRTTVFGGFNKDDVIKALGELTQEYEDRQGELLGYVSTADRSIKEYEKRIAEYETKQSEMRGSIDRANFLAVENENNYNVFKEENEKKILGLRQSYEAQAALLNESIAKKNNLISSLEKETDSLKESLSAAQAERVKSNHYAEAAEKIVQAAKEKAKEITGGAETGADKIIAETKRQSAEIIARARETAETTVNQANMKLHKIDTIISKRSDEMCQARLNEMKHSIERVKLSTIESMGRARRQIEELITGVKIKAKEIEDQSKAGAVEIIKRANLDAEGIIGRARQEAERIIREAHDSVREVPLDETNLAISVSQEFLTFKDEIETLKHSLNQEINQFMTKLKSI